MLARLQRRDSHLGVEGVRRGNGNHLHLGVGEEITPVAGRSLEAEFAGAPCGQTGLDLGEMHQPRLGAITKDWAYGVPGQGMALAHISRADQADADGFHR